MLAPEDTLLAIWGTDEECDTVPLLDYLLQQLPQRHGSVTLYQHRPSPDKEAETAAWRMMPLLSGSTAAQSDDGRLQ